MKKSISVIIVLLISVNFLYSQKRRVVKPNIKKNPVELIYGKKKSYYHLNNTLDFDVRGLKKIFIYSRERIIEKSNGYILTYNINNKKTESYTVVKSEIDKHSAYKSKTIHYRPSRVFVKEIVIPKNANTLHLFSGNYLIDVIVSKSSKKVKSIKAKKKKPTIILNGKTVNYYKLNSKIKTELKIKEAGKLHIYTRKRLSKKDNDKYSFSYKINNLKSTKVDVDNIKPAKYATYKSLLNRKKPSIYYKTTVDLKANSKISLSSFNNVDARFVFVKKWNEIFQKKSNRVDLVTKKGLKIRKYYRISNNKNFEFNFNAKKNTKAKIYIRGEFTYEMYSNNDYKVILKDYDEIITTYKLSCIRSKEMNYKNNAEKIPGTLDKIFFDIPKGKHHYTISIGDKQKTAILRVLIKK